MPNTSAVRILVYAVIPTDRAFSPILRSWMGRIRNRARRALEFARWRVFRSWRAHYSVFEDVNYSNKGDIAIRQGVCDQLRSAFAPQPVTLIEACWGELEEALREPVDLIVFAGSGYIYPTSNGKFPGRVAADLRALERSHVPAVAISLGLNGNIRGATFNGKAYTDDQTPLLRRLFQRFTLASVRDQNSRQVLQGAAASLPPVIVDPAFLLGRRLQKEIGRKRTELLSVGINIAFHSDFPSQIVQWFLPELIAALKCFNDAHPCKFFYFVHSDAERAIVKALRIAGLRMEVIDADVTTMYAGYAALDLHICQMLHSSILAMSMGVPTLALSYDVKSASFFRLFGLEKYCVEAWAIGGERILDALEELWTNRDEVAATIESQGDKLVERARYFYADIPGVLHISHLPSERSGIPSEIVAAEEGSDDWIAARQIG